jgi:hypothetical protein
MAWRVCSYLYWTQKRCCQVDTASFKGKDTLGGSELEYPTSISTGKDDKLMEKLAVALVWLARVEPSTPGFPKKVYTVPSTLT